MFSGSTLPIRMISRLCSQRQMDDIKALKQELEQSDPNINVNVPNFSVINAELIKNIEVDEVLTAIANAKKGKSFGLDMLPSEVFFNASSVLLIHSLFEKCFESGILPDTWSESVIKPILKNKSNDPRIPLNYRGISLIPTMCKLFSMILNERLTKVIESLDIICDEQNGFRKQRACIDHLFVLTSIIKNRKVRNLPTFACMVDFAKAFDKTDRNMLLFKLLINGLSGKFYNCIRSMYLSTKCCMNINTVLTDWFPTESGLKQGDNLSPTLWNIFLNDLVKEINDLNIGISIDTLKISILLYADDMVLLAENERNLMINKLNEFCTRWRLTINVDKTNVIHFRRATTPRSNYEFKCGNKILTYTSKYKYEGCSGSSWNLVIKC